LNTTCGAKISEPVFDGPVWMARDAQTQSESYPVTSIEGDIWGVCQRKNEIVFTA
jgi:hypothetical protein